MNLLNGWTSTGMILIKPDLLSGRINWKKHFSVDKPILDIQVKMKEDWFDIYANVIFGKFQIPFIKFKRYILNDIHEFELPNGEIAIIPQEWFTDYRDLLPFARQEGNNMRISKHHYYLLQQRLKGIDKSLFNRLDAMGKDGIKKGHPANRASGLAPFIPGRRFFMDPSLV